MIFPLRSDQNVSLGFRLHPKIYKATYLFTKVPATTASALLEFGELYRHSRAGDIPLNQLLLKF